jgi:pantoate kinase
MNRAEVDQIALAVQQYVSRFGTDPPLYQFMHKPRELAKEIRAAVARGQKLTDEDLYRRPGMQSPDAAP